MMDDFSYKFPAVRGLQNDRVFYQATVPFRVLASMLKLDDDFDVNKRSQRLVNKPRAKQVAKYLERNAEGFYVIPPLVGFIDGDFRFDEVPLDGYKNVGRMVVPVDLKIMLFDGQHRAFGIREAMDLVPELAPQNVAIMFFENMSLAERKQAFHDINYTQKTPAAALCIAYNDRSDFDRMLVDAVSSSILRGHIEYEKNTVSGNSENLYSLKAFKDFAVNLLGKEPQEGAMELMADYINVLFEAVSPIGKLSLSETPKHFRDQYVIGHAVMLQAFGLLGQKLICQHPHDWREKLDALKDRELWSRGAEHWVGRCVSREDKMISNKLAVRLTAYYLMTVCGLTLAPEERQEEKNHMQMLTDEAA